MTQPAPRPGTADRAAEAAVDAVLIVSRALVGVAARSLAATEAKVTLSQYRALVLLETRGAQNVGTLAEALGIHASTATRLCDRLRAKGLIERAPSTDNRREVTLTLSAAGRTLVRAETARRRKEIRRIVDCVDPGELEPLIASFRAVADAAAEVHEHAWKLGWTT
jgi:DNA-binding MarR family transcriptional regulator